MMSDQPPTFDHRSTDWPRVGRAVYRVRQHYRYTYTGPIADLKQRLVMVPRDRHADQRLLDHRFDVRGAGDAYTVHAEHDAIGNRVHRVLAERVEHAVDFEATYRVERTASEDAEDRDTSVDRGRLTEYLKPTALTAPDRCLMDAAGDLAAAASSPLERAKLAHDWAAGAIGYKFGVTGVQTPAAMALHLGSGVCQDYAHILLCLLRLLDVPARYVSGHLLGEGAPHAWVEALLVDRDSPSGVSVVAYDPTHRRRTGLNYITVAVGRDFADVTPTSGFFSGPASGKLSASKSAEMVELEYAEGDDEASDDGRRRTAA